MRDQAQEKKTRRMMYEKYGNLINKPKDEIPEEHRCKLNGSLRCFRKIIKKDSNGEDLKRKRCNNPACDGSLYCKKHGGGNNSALVTGKHATTALIYKNAYPHELGNLLTSFLNDPSILDLKPELATVRTILHNYIKKLANAEQKNPKRFNAVVKSILEDKTASEEEKCSSIMILVEEQMNLMNGQAIDRINRTIETIGKTVDRINKATNREEFILTPDGLKILLRAIVETIKATVIDEKVQSNIREQLLKISTMTNGDLVNYKNSEIIDVEYEDVVK